MDYSKLNTDREILIQKLIMQNSFWSYNITFDDLIPDDVLIEKTLIYLDIEDINKLFGIFPSKKIKQVWCDRLVIQGDYYRRLNKLIAWLYFDIKNPDRYIKRIIGVHLKKFQ
jgi:hypothetical protein